MKYLKKLNYFFKFTRVNIIFYIVCFVEENYIEKIFNQIYRLYLSIVNENVFIHLDVWEMLKNMRFNEVSNLITKQPNIINSMRGRYNRTLLMVAARNQRKDCVVFLLNQPHDVSVVNDGWNVLHYIIDYNYDDEAIELLECLDISQLNNNIINQQNLYKLTPLHYAAVLNRHKSIRWLLKHGANPSHKDGDGLRPDEYDDCDDETKSIILAHRKW